MRSSLYRRPATLWLMVLSVILLTACSQGTSSGSTSAAVSGGTINVRLNGDWSSLDIQTFTSANSWDVSMALYDRLLSVDGSGKLLPYLARSWKASPSSITFTLRNDATCADGTPVNATVVANSIKRLISIGQAPRSFGAGPYTVTADDAASTVTLTLGTPFSDAIYSFANAQLGIVCPAGLADPTQLTDKSFGSGPFVIEQATHGDSITLDARPGWNWGPYGLTARSSGFPQKLVFKVVANETTAANLLLTGGLDVGSVTGTDVTRLRASKSLTTHIVRSFIVNPLVLNEAAGHPTSDKAVRQAIVTAVDPKAWVQAAYAGFAQTGTSIFASNMPCYDPSTASLMPKTSVDAARSILMNDGYVVGANGKLAKDGKPLNININGTTTLASGPEYLSSVLTQVGFTVNLSDTDYNTYAGNTRAGNYDVTIHQLNSTIPAPYATISLFSGPVPPKGINLSWIVDPTLDQEAAAALASTGTERCQHWANVQRRLLQMYDLLPLARPDTSWFSHGVSFQVTSYLEPGSLKRTS